MAISLSKETYTGFRSGSDFRARWLDPWVSPNHYRRAKRFSKGSVGHMETLFLRGMHTRDLLVDAIHCVSKSAFYSFLGASILGGASCGMSVMVLSSNAASGLSFSHFAMIGTGIFLGFGLGGSYGLQSVTGGQRANDMKVNFLGILSPALAAERALKLDSDRFWLGAEKRVRALVSGIEKRIRNSCEMILLGTVVAVACIESLTILGTSAYLGISAHNSMLRSGGRLMVQISR